MQARILPWTNKFNAERREALGLNIANGWRFDSPILGAHVPTGIEQIGSWRIGNELAECLKYRQIPEIPSTSLVLNESLVSELALQTLYY